MSALRRSEYVKNFLPELIFSEEEKNDRCNKTGTYSIFSYFYFLNEVHHHNNIIQLADFY